MINELMLMPAAETNSGTVLFSLIIIVIGISAIWAAIQTYKAWKTFRRLIDQGRSH